MKILIFSDSHRNLQPMETAILEENPDNVIHLGDLESDAEDLRRFFPRLPIASIPGNCDNYTAAERYKIFTLAGKRFFITHGHFYGVKLSLDRLVNTALTAGANVALFGHTHFPHFSEVEGMLVINPGTIGMGRRTYGVLTIENGKMSYELKEV